MRKKANMFTDLIVYMIVIFVFAISMGLIYYMVNTVHDKLMDIAPTFSHDSVNGTQIAQSTIGYLPSGFEPLKWISYMLIIGLGISVILGNFLVRTHPVLVVPYILILAIAITMAVPLSNTYEDLMYHNEIIGATLQGFYGQSWIFLHLPMWIFVIGLLSGIVMFINIIRDRNAGDMY